MTWLGSGKIALLAAGAALAGMAVLAPGAEARGFVGLSLGVPLGPPAYYYPPPPPVYVYPAYPAYPAPVYAAPPAPAYAPPRAPAAAPGPQAQENCREYQSSTTIDGRPQQVYGTVCLQPDGSWRIVR